MSGLIGKKNSTLKKGSITESKLLTTGVKNIKFWHEASEGDTVIPFSSLVLPTTIQEAGLSNPSGAEIQAANLAFFKENVEVRSSLNGDLMIGLTYKVGSTQIELVNGYTAIEGEVFEIVYRNEVITGNPIVDGRIITATGVLSAGNTDFNVGEAFLTNQYPSEQIGEVMVFVDGQIQFRNVGNATAAPAADGNYQEVTASNGFGTIIRFNDTFVEDKNIIVMSRSLIAERPNVSMMQFIEVLGGQLDAIIETVAILAGVDESEFQTAPNQIDLKAFGDRVLENQNRIVDLEAARVNDNETTIDLTGSGQFTGGDIKVVRVGDIVTISALNIINNSSSSDATSAAGLIPVWARPVAQKRNIYEAGASEVYTMIVNPDGTFRIQYRDYSGTLVNRTSGAATGTLSYVI